MSLVPAGAAIGKEIVLSEDSKRVPIEGNYLYLEDKQGNWTIHDVMENVEFHSGSKRTPNFGYSASAYWLKFQVRNQSRNNDWYVQLENPFLNEIELYQTSRNELVQIKHTGTSYPFNQREIKHRFFVFDQFLEEEEVYTYYIRVASSSTLAMPITFIDHNEFFEKDRLEYLLFGLYYGIVLGLAGYNLFLFFSLKRVAYLYYVLFISFFAFFLSAWNGLANQFLWTQSVWWANYSTPIFMLCCGLFVLLFTQSFFQTKIHLPFLNKIITFFIVYCSISLMLAFFLPYHILIMLGLSVTMIAFVIVIPTSLISWYKGYSHARFFVLAWIVVIIGTLSSTIRNIGLLPDNIFTIYGMQIASAIEVVLLSIALVDQINKMKKEKELAQLAAFATQQKLIEAKEEWAQSLEETVQRRTEALKATVKELQEAQSQLLEQEKMASLGNLVAGVAHEINTPLGIAYTAATHSEGKLNEFLEIYSKNKLKRSDLEKFIQSIQDANSIVVPNLQRAAEMVKSFKQVAVDQSTMEHRSFNLKEYLEETILSLKPKLRKTNISIQISGDDDLFIIGNPGAYYQVVTNLVINSITHAYEGDQHGLISMDIATTAHHLEIVYKDFGKGMDEKTKEKIYEPFFTTRRGKGGSGLGMHIVYNVVHQQLNGTIRCESRRGEGTTFFLTIPLLKSN